MIVHALVNGPCIAVWAMGPRCPARWLPPLRQRLFNLVMALLLVASLYPILVN